MLLRIVGPGLLTGVLVAAPCAAQFPDSFDESEEHAGMVVARLGATYRRVYDIPVYGGEPGLCIGSWDRAGTGCLNLSLFWGRTEGGLEARAFGARYRLDRPVAGVYAGAEAGLGMLWFIRATNGESLSSAALMLAPLLGFVVLRSDSGVLGVEATFNLDLAFGADVAVFWGPALYASCRL